MTGTYIIYRWAPCPVCQASVRRSRVFFAGRELYAGKLCVCPACDTAATASRPTFRDVWEKTCPPDYQAATPASVPPQLRDVLRWRPRDRQQGVGIYGPSGRGKTHAIALLALALETPFAWATGARMRQLSGDAAMLTGRDRDDARKELGILRDVPLLIIDDVAEVKFTEAWADKLFEILEYRNSTRRLTCWTAQHGPGQLAAKIVGKGEYRLDAGTGDAIERRLVQHHTIFEA